MKKFKCPNCRKTACNCNYCDPCPACGVKIDPTLLVCPHCRHEIDPDAPPPPKAEKITQRSVKTEVVVKKRVAMPSNYDWADSDKRFVVGVNNGNQGEYRDYFDTDKLHEAKERATQLATDSGLKTIVHDRQPTTMDSPIVFRYDPTIPSEDQIQKGQ